MKKFLWILVLGLLWCNVSFAEVIKLSRYYLSDKWSGAKIDVDSSFEETDYKEQWYSINFNIIKSNKKF